MKKEIVNQLAKEAGFCMWENEPWKPEGATVDWASGYDVELEKFVELIVTECVDLIRDFMDYTDYENEPEKAEVELKAQREIVKALKMHFGV